jgi:hypothetical protein
MVCFSNDNIINTFLGIINRIPIIYLLNSNKLCGSSTNLYAFNYFTGVVISTKVHTSFESKLLRGMGNIKFLFFVTIRVDRYIHT